MPAIRRARVTFTGVTKLRGAGGSGVMLVFRPHSTRLGVDRIDAFAMLGPELDLPVVEGIGKVLRILRAARIAAPGTAADWLDRAEEITALLERAVGTMLSLELRPRSRLRFVAWTDEGIETVEDMSDVVESRDAYWVRRLNGHFPVRFDRDAVVRKQTECERWFEVVGIERAEPGAAR